MNESDIEPGDHAVETAGLTKRFGDRTAVDRVDLRVPAGTAFGYLGPNGAGKTTLIRMLLGLTKPTAGSMWLLGYPVPEQRSAGSGQCHHARRCGGGRGRELGADHARRRGLAHQHPRRLSHSTWKETLKEG